MKIPPDNRAFALRLLIGAMAIVALAAGVYLFAIGSVEGGTACLGVMGTLVGYLTRRVGDTDTLRIGRDHDGP